MINIPSDIPSVNNHTMVSPQDVRIEYEMFPPQIEINTNGPGPNTEVKINGEQIHGVRHVNFSVGVDQMPRVVLEIIGDNVRLNGNNIDIDERNFEL